MSLRLSGGRRLQSPAGLGARPTPARVRQAVMNMLAAELPGCRWLDLCSGSGAMACEALLRGAARVVAVDQDRSHLAVARANLEAVVRGLGPGEREALVRRNEVLRWLQAGRERAGEQPFDLIYADPPYATGLHAPLAEAVLRQDWLCRQGTLLLECASAKLPELFPGWELLDQRRYGTTTVLRLQQP
ncbi:MAG: 16S rRNA (guanine(966)-N(2))-methyltransferase RsmD [Cyanobacteriota bacterium]